MTEQAPYRMQRETPQHRFLRLGIDALVALLVALNWIATQLIAAVLHYPRFLMGRLVGFIYQPFAWWWWWHYWPHHLVRVGHQVISLERAWRLCQHIVFYPTIVLVVIGGLISGLLLKSGGQADLHGSAAWGDRAEVRRGGLL